METKTYLSKKTGYSVTLEGPDHRGAYLVEMWDAKGSRVDKTQCLDGRREALEEFNAFKVCAELMGEPCAR